MKKKVKRYQDGGVLRDRYGNPVRSGSGEVVRTRFPERSYDEQASASMTESSDYTGRRMKSPDVEDMGDSSYMPKGRSGAPDIGYGGGDEDEGPRTLAKYMRSSPKEDSVTVEEKEEVTVKPKAKPKPKAKTATELARKMGEGYMKAAEAAKPAKKEPMYDLAKAGRALADTFSSERATKRYAESTPYARAKYGMKSGGKVSSASSRADGIAQRGKTKGRIC